MADVLIEFLRKAAAAPHEFGEWDCAMSLANWVRAQTGSDPAPDLRGRYHTKIGWLRIVRREGGLVSLVGRLAASVGMKPTEKPIAGDIGIIDVPELGPAGAIKVDRGWATKLRDGIIVAPARHHAAWTF